MLYLIFACIFSFICARYAKSKKRDPLNWGMLGFLFGVIALIILACVKPGTDSMEAEPQRL